MKLWKKIAVISCAVVALLFSGIFLTVTHQVKTNYLAHTQAQAARDHSDLLITFLRQIQKTQGKASEAETKYIFSQQGDQTSVLAREGKLLVSHIPFDPQQLLQTPEDGSTPMLMTEVEGIPYLLYGSWLSPFGPEDPGFSLYTVIDLTELYGEIRHMALTTAGSMGAAMLLGLIAIVAIVYITMRPLERLNTAAGRIAEGNYEERIGIHRKDEIGELSQSFDRMADSVQSTVSDLQEQNRRQKLFIGAVSHEFKTPLTSLLLNADSLQNTYMTQEEQQDAFSNIEKQCKWLQKMTGSLLQLLSSRPGQEPEPADLDLDGASPFFRADKLYFYFYDGRYDRMKEAVIHIHKNARHEDGSYEASMSIRYSTPTGRSCDVHYSGNVLYSDMLIRFSFLNRYNKLEQDLLYIFNPLELRDYTDGLLCGISSTDLMPCAFKCLVTLSPEEDLQSLRSHLMLTPKELHRWQKMNMFIVDNNAQGPL